MDIDDLCKQVTKITGKDPELVKQVVSWVFKYTADVMKDQNDKRDILFNKLFKFKLKNRFKNEKADNKERLHV